MKKTFSKPILFLFALILFPGLARSAETPARCPQLPAELQPFVHRIIASRSDDLFVILRNGLTLLISPKAANDVVSAQVFVRAGSIYEGKHLSAGLSHYLEHVVAGGSTRSFPESEIKERLQRMGGATNAHTTYDRTVYYINTSAGHWKDALELLLSYVSENTQDEREVAREKAVIQQEIKMGENNPDSELWKLFMRTAFRVSPVRIPVIGYEEVFVKQDRSALMEYYRERYQPQNIVVAVAGNVIPSEVLKFVAEKTKDFVRSSDELVSLPSEPVPLTPRWEEKTSRVARLTQATAGFPTVTLQNRDLYALDVLAIIMGEGRTSRLYTRLKEKENRVLGVSASNWTPSYVQGQFMISLAMPPQNWPDALKSVQEEIDRVKNSPVSAEELNRAKKLAVSQHIFAKETAAARAVSLASSYFETGDPYFDDSYVEGLRKVTAAEIQDVARRYLVGERMSVAVLKPAAPAETSAASQPCPPAESRGKAPELRQMKNGLKALVKRDDSLPTATVQLYGLGGLLLEDRQKPGISSFTSSLLTAGTTKRSKSQIMHAIEDAGGAIESRSDNNTYHIAIRVLKEDLDLALDILADIVQNASFPQDEIDKKKKETLLEIQRQDESWQIEIGRLFKANYFHDSPYGNDRLGTAESVKSFSRKDLMELHRRMAIPSRSVLAVYGDFDTEKVFSKINGMLSGWKGVESAPPTLKDETHCLAADRVVEAKSDKSSAGLFIGTNGISVNDPRRATLDLLNTVLMGAHYPGGRLFEALRGGSEDLVYVVGAYPFYGERAGYYGVLTQTTLGNLDRVQGVVLEHLKQLCEEPVPAEELERAKNMLLTMYRLEAESLGAQAQRAAVDEVLGLGYRYDEQYVKEVGAVTAEQMQAAAKDLFGAHLIIRMLPEHPVEILSAPQPKSDADAR